MRRAALRLYFVANVVLLTILGLTLPFQRPDTGAFVITVLALAVVVPSVVVSGALIYFDVRIPPLERG